MIRTPGTKLNKCTYNFALLNKFSTAPFIIMIIICIIPRLIVQYNMWRTLSKRTEEALWYSGIRFLTRTELSALLMKPPFSNW